MLLSISSFHSVIISVFRTDEPGKYFQDRGLIRKILNETSNWSSKKIQLNF